MIIVDVQGRSLHERIRRNGQTCDFTHLENKGWTPVDVKLKDSATGKFIETVDDDMFHVTYKEIGWKAVFRKHHTKTSGHDYIFCRHGQFMKVEDGELLMTTIDLRDEELSTLVFRQTVEFSEKFLHHVKSKKYVHKCVPGYFHNKLCLGRRKHARNIEVELL